MVIMLLAAQPFTKRLLIKQQKLNWHFMLPWSWKLLPRLPRHVALDRLVATSGRFDGTDIWNNNMTERKYVHADTRARETIQSTSNFAHWRRIERSDITPASVISLQSSFMFSIYTNENNTDNSRLFVYLSTLHHTNLSINCLSNTRI